jgi:hypothetical protein
MKRIAIILTALISTLASGQQQIPFINVPSISNIVRGEDAKPLFDGDVSTVYNPTFPSWTAMINPVTTDILVDTKYYSCIPRQIKFLQQTGANFGTKLYFTNKTTKAKVLIYTFDGSGGYQPDTYQVFNIPDSNQFEVSRITFEAPSGGPSYPNEVQFWGNYTEAQIVLKPRAPSPLSDLFGFVCYPWNTAFSQWPSSKDAFDQLKPSRIRVYDDYSNIFNSTTRQPNWHWNQLNEYNTLKGMGVKVKDCIQNTPWYPYPLGDTRLDPATYLELGRDLQKYAIANKAVGSPSVMIQLENEWDRSWVGPGPYMDGYAIAAACSMGYDGHKGKYPDAGVKQIDPSVEFVNPGCATDRTQILYQMLLWTVENRGYRADGTVDFPFDRYELHWYQSLGGQYAGKPGGMPPELVIGRLQEVIDFFKQYAPRVKVDIGEYGLDVNQYSDLNAPAYGKYTAQQVRAIWFARDLMMFAKTGIDGADWYRETMDWVDDPADPTGQTNLMDQNGNFFETMDLITPNHYAQPAVYTRRIVGDYFRQLGDLLRRGFVFAGVVSTSPYVFKFTKADTTLYALWNLETVTWPTDGGRAAFTENVSKYTLNGSGQLLRFIDGGDTMSREPYNGAEITVDAKPVFVIINPIQRALPVHLISFTADKFSKSVVLKWIVQDAEKVEVERSTDGRTWTNLGEGILNKLIDMHPVQGKNYYRLKMYEPDGSFTYSFIRTVSFSGNAKVNVYNVSGQLIKNRNERRY